MADLKVDIDVLTESESALSTIKTEFDDLDERRDETRDIWGHDSVADAMSEFVDNMKHHRKDLSNKIEDLGKKTATTRETFEKADQKLKDELTKNTEKK